VLWYVSEFAWFVGIDAMEITFLLQAFEAVILAVQKLVVLLQ